MCKHVTALPLPLPALIPWKLSAVHYHSGGNVTWNCIAAMIFATIISSQDILYIMHQLKSMKTMAATVVAGDSVNNQLKGAAEKTTTTETTTAMETARVSQKAAVVAMLLVGGGMQVLEEAITIVWGIFGLCFKVKCHAIWGR